MLRIEINLLVEGKDAYELQGKLIKVARVAKGWTQQELGEKLGCSRGAIARMEQRGTDSVLIFKIESVLGCELRSVPSGGNAVP